MDYSAMSDEELLAACKNGKENEEALGVLLMRYKHTVNMVARAYFLSGGDTDDLLQEGMIGVFKAISTYNGKSSFKNYAYKCIKTTILSAVKKSGRLKNKPLYNYISLSSEEGDDDKNAFLSDDSFDPEEKYINDEAEKELKARIKESLSELEYKILNLYLAGYSYREIAEKTDKSVKSVDNAVQRIRKKILRATEAAEAE